MRKTGFLKLHLPDEHEYYNVELDQNQNFIRVDEKLKEHDTALTTIQQGATNEQKGIVQFGIEEGKALEGNMLARLAGAYGFGGDIQNPGVKNQNYIYYDNNTRKMYKCLNQNSDTSANVQNYVPIDNFSFLERLENLSKNNYYVTIETPGTLMNVLKKLDDKVNLVQFYYLEIISDFKNFGLSGGGELFKIIHNAYGIRWILWTKNPRKAYLVFAWNINESSFFIKEI